MSEELNIEKLREEVNPVYSTAQSCLQLAARLGDEESEALRKTLGFSDFGADTFWLWFILGSLIYIGPYVYIYKRIVAMNQLNDLYNKEKGY